MKIDLSKKSNISASSVFNSMLGVDDKVDIKKDISYIDISFLVEYENQPFKPYTKEKLEELAEDIKLNGVLSPIIVRPLEENKYQILSGHNRVNACKLVEIKQAPCIIKEVDDSTANLILVNANLNQRQELLPSEKAFAYKLQMESSKQNKGTRNDLLHNVQKVDTANKIAIENNESKRNISYYIRLTELTKPLLDMVDEKILPFRAGVNLSYLPPKEQETVYNYIIDNKIKLSLVKSEEIKNLAKENNINLFQLEYIFKKNKKEKDPTYVKLSYKKLEKYIDTSLQSENIEEYILKALHFYKNKENR